LVWKKFDDAEQGLFGRDDAFVVLPVLVGQTGRKNCGVGQTDNFGLFAETATFDECRVTRHQPAIAVLREEECTGEVVKQVTKLSSWELIGPLFGGCFKVHLAESYTINPQSYKPIFQETDSI
jgi:hypothetical protein